MEWFWGTDLETSSSGIGPGLVLDCLHYTKPEPVLQLLYIAYQKSDRSASTLWICSTFNSSKVVYITARTVPKSIGVNVLSQTCASPDFN